VQLLEPCCRASLATRRITCLASAADDEIRCGLYNFCSWVHLIAVASSDSSTRPLVHVLSGCLFVYSWCGSFDNDDLLYSSTVDSRVQTSKDGTIL
jgi:hypothetical protein